MEENAGDEPAFFLYKNFEKSQKQLKYVSLMTVGVTRALLSFNRKEKQGRHKEGNTPCLKTVYRERRST